VPGSSSCVCRCLLPLCCFVIDGKSPGAERLLSDILGYMTPVVALLLLFPAVPELGMTLLVILAFGDGSATLSGLLLGGRALPWNRNKTWSGLISFLCLSAPLAFLAFTATASPSWPLMHALQVSAAGAVAGAFAETFPLRGSDNTSVGVVGGLAILATHFAATHFAG